MPCRITCRTSIDEGQSKSRGKHQQRRPRGKKLCNVGKLRQRTRSKALSEGSSGSSSAGAFPALPPFALARRLVRFPPLGITPRGDDVGDGGESCRVGVDRRRTSATQPELVLGGSRHSGRESTRRGVTTGDEVKSGDLVEGAAATCGGYGGITGSWCRDATLCSVLLRCGGWSESADLFF